LLVTLAKIMNLLGIFWLPGIKMGSQGPNWSRLIPVVRVGLINCRWVDWMVVTLNIPKEKSNNVYI